MSFFSIARILNDIVDRTADSMMLAAGKRITCLTQQPHRISCSIITYFPNTIIMKKGYSFQKMLVTVLLAIFTVAFSNNVMAEANYVYHEATTNNPGCGPNYRSVLTPNSSQSLQLAWKVEYQNYTTNTVVYYTTDGTTPSGAFGVGSGTTQVLTGSYNCTFGSPVVDVATATIPAQAAGKTVKYIISAWHSGGGDEIFANGPGAPCACGTPTNNAALATVFSYTVANANNVEVSATVGTTIGSYATLKGAFDAINAGTHRGVVAVSIYANTTETASSVLNYNGQGTAVYTSVSVRPANDGVSVSGASVTGRGLIEVLAASTSAADATITIDGDNPNTAGTNRNLTLQLTGSATSSSSLFRVAMNSTTSATTLVKASGITVRNMVMTGNVTSGNGSLNTSTANTYSTTMGVCVLGSATAGALGTTAGQMTTSPNANEILNNFVVDNCSINQVGFGINVYNNSASSSNSMSFTNNIIGDQATTLSTFPSSSPVTTVYYKGITLRGAQSLAVTGNTIKNITSYIGGAMFGIEISGSMGSGTNLINISDNNITGVWYNGTSAFVPKGISTAGLLSTNVRLNNNTISSIQTNGAASGTTGMDLGSSASSPVGVASNNNISKVYNNSTGGWGATGLAISGGNGWHIYNNRISDVGFGGAGSFGSAIFNAFGIRIGAGNTHKFYHNSVLLNYNFGSNQHMSTCIYIGGSGQSSLDIRNNIFANYSSTTNASSVDVGLVLPSTQAGSTTFLLTINNNVYYTGSGASNGIAYGYNGSSYTAGNANAPTTYAGLYPVAGFNNGTTSGATNLRAYTSKLLNGPTNNDSVSVAVTGATNNPFASATDLHISSSIASAPSRLESRGASGLTVNGVGVSPDFEGHTRPGPSGSTNGGATAPDLGADEFDGVPIPQCTGTPSAGTIGASVTTLTCSGTSTISLTGASSDDGITYQWYSAPETSPGSNTPGTFTAISGATGSSYAPAANSISATTFYQCVVTCFYSGLSVTSGTQQITVNAISGITISPSSVCINTGGTTTLSLVGTLPGSGVTYSWRSSADGYTATIGTNSTVTVSPTVATTYKCFITCTATSAVFETPATTINTPSYASLPVTEDFETWSSTCGNSDIPTGAGSNVWRNYPVMSDSSWRRDDQGVSTAGWFTNTGSLTTPFTTGAHAARFHSYQTTKQGKLDLYVDCSSGNAEKRFTFDYNNVTPTVGTANDVLYVELSTDGGTNFTTLGTLGTNAGWVGQTFDFNTMSSTVVIRFRGQGNTGSNFGASDIHIDNLQVFSLTSCSGTPEAGSAAASVTSGTCSVSSSILSLSGTTVAAGLTYQWQVSSDNSLFTDISGANASSYTTGTLDSTRYYRCKVTCSNSAEFDYSSVATITVNAPNGGTAQTVTSLPIACSGSAILNATGTTSSAITYQWQKSTDGGSNYANVGSSSTSTTGYTTETLTNSTYYRLKVSCNAPGSQYSYSVPLEITVTPAAQYYAALPYSQGFEDAWDSKCDVNDVPYDGISGESNWTNAPATGNISFRRNDDGSSAGWTSPSGGGYTIASSQGTYSARIHSSASGTGFPTSNFDLHIDANTANTYKKLTFDWYNPGTANVLAIYVSTDGGANFTAVSGASFTGNQSTWVGKTVTFASTSATTVIRFHVTSANGGDMGIDNVNVEDVPNCTGTPAAGSVSSNSGSSYCGAATVPNIITYTANGYENTTGGITLQWESSTDGSNYDPIVGETTPTYTTSTAPSVTTYYRVAVTCTFSNQTSYSTPFQLTITEPPTISSVTPTVSAVCKADGTSFTITATSATADYYNWSGIGIQSGQGTPTITVIIPTNYAGATAQYTVNGKIGGASGCAGVIYDNGGGVSASITVNTNPTAYAVTGGGVYCNGGSSVSVGVSNSQTGVSYQLYRGATAVGSAIGGNTGNPVDFGAQTIAGTYTVVATNDLSGCTTAMTGNAVITITSYTITTSAGANGSITPTANVDCGNNAAITITPNAGYLVQDVLVDGNPQGAITSYTFINVQANHTISASFVSACTPLTPAVISGQGSIGCNKLTSPVNGVVYSVPNVAGATYTWSVVSTATMQIASGQGTNSITVNFLTNFINGNITVLVSNGCSSYTNTFKVITSTTAQPQSITASTTDVCTSMSGVTFTTRKTLGATSYKFYIPTGASFVSPNGTVYGPSVDTLITADTTCVVSFPGSFTSGSVGAAGVNSCGTSSFVAMTVSKKTSVQPGTIVRSGEILGSICNGDEVQLAIANPASSNSDGYIFTLPSGCTISDVGANTTLDSANIAGNYVRVLADAPGDSIRIKVTFGTGYITGIANAYSFRNCGSLSINPTGRSITLTRVLPSAITLSPATNTNVCGIMLAGGIVEYTLTPAVGGAAPTYYQWNVGGSGVTIAYTGAGGSGNLGVTSVTTSSSVYTIGVKFSNNTNVSPARWVSVAPVRFCGTDGTGPTRKNNAVLNSSCIIPPAANNRVAGGAGTGIINTATVTTASVYPNPNSGAFRLRIESTNKVDNAKVQVVNMLGQVVRELVGVNVGGIIDIRIGESKLAGGVYNLKYRVGTETGSVKMVIQR